MKNDIEKLCNDLINEDKEIKFKMEVCSKLDFKAQYDQLDKHSNILCNLKLDLKTILHNNIDQKVFNKFKDEQLSIRHYSDGSGCLFNESTGTRMTGWENYKEKEIKLREILNQK